MSEDMRRRGAQVRARPTALPVSQHRTTVLTIAPLDQQPGLRLIGEIDLATHHLLEAALSAVAVGSSDVHVDLAELTFIDLGGATLLVTLAERLGPNQRLILHRPPPQLRRVIDLLWGEWPTIELDMR